MVKRITYLERRHDLTEAQFREHWSTTHADIARGLPRVLSYRQNHMVEHAPPVDGQMPYLVDGIVELWFLDEDAAGAGFGSEVADRLIEDEKRFMSGLTGSAVHSGGPTPDWAHKLWLLARIAGETPDGAAVGGGGAIERWATEQCVVSGASGVAVNWLDESAPVLEREALRKEPQLPQLAIVLGFERAEAAQNQLQVLSKFAQSLPFLERAQVFRAEELRII